MNAALAAGLLVIELPRRLPLKTTQGKKPALLGEDISESCRRIRREGMYHKGTLFVKYFIYAPELI